MNKKQIRQNLEATLVKNIEDLLLSINPEATNKVLDIVFGASKIIAKKFYKSIKQQQQRKETPVAKKASKKSKATPAPKKKTAAPAKTAAAKSKTKSQK